jgi:hypothetical protein
MQEKNVTVNVSDVSVKQKAPILFPLTETQRSRRTQRKNLRALCVLCVSVRGKKKNLRVLSELRASVRGKNKRNPQC